MTDKKDNVILNEEDQKLSNSVTETKQAGPSTAQEVRDYKTVEDPAQDKLAYGKFDEKGTDAGDKTEAKGKTETADKANQMRDSLKAKTDTTATDKSINQFQIGKKSDFDEQNKVKFEGLKQQEKQLAKIRKGKKAALAAVKKVEAEEEAANAAYQKAKEEIEQFGQRTKELNDFLAKTKIEGKKDRFSLDNLKKAVTLTNDLFFKGDFIKSRDQLAELAKEKGIEIEDLSKDITGNKTAKALETINNTLEARMQEALTNQQKVQKVAESARKQLAEVTTKEQEAQAKYDKDQKDYKTWEAKYRAGAEKDEKEAEKEAETKTEKDETEDPLKKAEELEEELEQKKYQTPTDIKKFSNDLNRFVIQAYLKGDFGKKSSPNTIATMGFFILDKIGAALVNASEVARGMSPSAKSQWSNILDKQTELLGKRITANWFLNLTKAEQEALIRSGVISGTTAQTIYETTDPNAVTRAEQRDVLEISKLSQEQKGVAQSNFNALLARKSELQTLITQLRSDQGWEVYAQAMNAVVGTAKGLNSLGVTDASNSSSNKGFSDTLSANVSTGKVTAAFVSGGISNNSSWNNSSAKALNKSKSLSQDALALSKFKSGESYAKATREAKKEANEQLIKRLENQIEIIDKCIDSWGKDLGL